MGWFFEKFKVFRTYLIVDAQVSIAFTFRNGTGYYRWEADADCSSKEFQYNRDEEGPGGTVVIDYGSYIKYFYLPIFRKIFPVD